MNTRRVYVMAKKDVVLTVRQGFFLFMVLIPIAMTLVLNAALGTMGSSPPTLGVSGEGELVGLLEEKSSIRVVPVPSEDELRNAVLAGEYDAGLIIPAASESAGGAPLLLLISGKSLSNDRLTIGSTVLYAYREQAHTGEFAVYETKVVGSEEFSLKVRMIPFLLIFATLIAGLIISSSLIEEREMRTLNAVLVTPITPFEVILAKSLYGLFLGLALSVLILVLNRSFRGGTYLLFLFLVLGALFAVGLGLIAGAVMKNITDLMARMKLLNIFLVVPALIILFPQIPQWIGYFFPTYYFIDPILRITQKGAVWSDVWWEAVVLVAVDVVVLVLASRVLRERMLGREVRV